MIRHATPDDLPRLKEMGRAMHAESPVLSVFEIDMDKVEQSIVFGMKKGVVLVHLDAAEAIDGVFLGVVNEWWFSRRLMFCDLAFYVVPESRGGLVAFRLLRAALDWARDQGLNPEDVQLGVSTGVHPELTGRLYERFNFERFGDLYRLKEF